MLGLSLLNPVLLIAPASPPTWWIQVFWGYICPYLQPTQQIAPSELSEPSFAHISGVSQPKLQFLSLWGPFANVPNQPVAWLKMTQDKNLASTKLLWRSGSCKTSPASSLSDSLHCVCFILFMSLLEEIVKENLSQVGCLLPHFTVCLYSDRGYAQVDTSGCGIYIIVYIYIYICIYIHIYHNT